MVYKGTSADSIYGVFVIVVLSVLLFTSTNSAEDCYFMNKASQMQDVEKISFNDYRYWVYCYK